MRRSRIKDLGQKANFKIFFGISFTSFVLLLSQANAGSIQFSAQIDREVISVNDSVALKFVVTLDNNASASQPQFNAPDFRVVNEFNSISVQYDSTRGMQKSQEITEVLRPLKTGSLKISGIQIKIDNQIFKASDLLVEVKNSAGPSNSNQMGSGQGLQSQGSKIRIGNSNSQNPQRGTNAFIKAEIERPTVYKGEQLVVSYYLYHQMKVFNLQVDKFPVLSGFLREDLEMPIMGQRLNSEQVVMKGETYQRSLLARYAAYPLQEGKLDIDSMILKFNYYTNQRNTLLDDEDPFFSFFKQMAPRAASAESERVGIQVLPLPEAGRPASFVGGVGDFNVISAINKYEVKANEAVSFVLKVEGKGNITNIQEPKEKWPAGIELYESKGKAQTGRSGNSEKIFEFLLIPRVSGKVKLPAIELGFFDPIQKKYYTKSTEPIDLNVLDPAPGTPAQPITQNPSNLKRLDPVKTTPDQEKTDEIRGLKPLVLATNTGNSWAIWRLLYLACVSGFGFLSLLMIRDFFRTRKNSQVPKPKWELLHTRARQAIAGCPWQEVTEAYEILTDTVFTALEKEYPVGVRSVSRGQLKSLLIEEGLPSQVWDKIVVLLEFAELVRFASSVGAVSEAEARSKLAHWVSEAEEIAKNIPRSS